jgi:hypothetical protein
MPDQAGGGENLTHAAIGVSGEVIIPDHRAGALIEIKSGS